MECELLPETLRRRFLRSLIGITGRSTPLGVFALTVLCVPAMAQDAWNLFSLKDDERLGIELSAWLTPRVQRVDDRRLDRYLDRIASRLYEAGAPLAFPLEFQLIDAAEPHAFALPGGRVVLTTGLIAAMDDERQLAGLLAHVAAHSELRHTTRAVSRAERFRAQAAIVVAGKTDKTLLQTLVETGLDVVPGAPLLYHDLAQEAEADGESGDWLDLAGYGAESIVDAFERLHTKFPEQSARFLERHPGARSIRAPPAEVPRSRRPVASNRKFANIRQQAGQFAGTSPGLDSALAWTPPPKPIRVASRHERFITSSYQFEYPLDWRPSKPGIDETIQVAPKGGIDQPAGSEPQLVLGVLAGAPELDDEAASGEHLLFDKIAAVRPGLRPAADQRGIRPIDNRTETILLEGESPLSEQRELVWAVSRRLPGHFFYLLMIAPEAQFSEYRTLFEDIFQSIEFKGPPNTIGGGPEGKLSR